MNVGIIGGADGPTAILVSGEEMFASFFTGLGIGVVVGVAATLAVIGIIKLIKKNRKK